MLSYRETEDLNYKDIQEILLFGTIGYKDIDITGNTSYTDVNHAA